MRKTLVLGSIALTIGFGVGACVGFFLLARWMLPTEQIQAADAAVALGNLQLLRESKIEQVINLNEQILDGAILALGQSQADSAQNRDIVRKTLRQIHSYRSEYPRFLDDRDLQQRLKMILKNVE